ncbi:AAA family ATPase [Actinoplanes sp. N902-109]|uniref:MinD/ParA family ATP-binding protein n=1 Tax=Actinoplanes sp. (strain N902-109) TaxID=649831 RepID=UPI0006885443
MSADRAGHLFPEQGGESFGGRAAPGLPARSGEAPPRQDSPRQEWPQPDRGAPGLPARAGEAPPRQDPPRQEWPQPDRGAAGGPRGPEWSSDRGVAPGERPGSPLEMRRQSRIGEGFQARSEAEPHSFFNPPPSRPVPPSRGAASVGSASVPPPAPNPPVQNPPVQNPPAHTVPGQHPQGPMPGRGAPGPLPPAPGPSGQGMAGQVPQGLAGQVPPVQSPPAQGSAPIAPVSGPAPLSSPPAPSLPTPVQRSAAQPVAAHPTSPAARIEWRQTRPEPEDRAASVLRRKLGKPRVLAFANPKGGVHKTTATVLAAATIGSVRGRGVLAWDDNELRGTLGLRAGSARHARTIRHLVGDLIEIENMHGNELMQFFDGYLRHASDGSYDVLAGEENPRFAQRLDQSTVRRVMDLLRRTHDVICVDTGNNVESVNWQTVMRSADQLVVTTVPREDAAFTADWMLDVLNETGMEELVANAVTLISCPSPGNLPLLDDLAKHFATRTRAVAVVPYDPALEVGSSIEYGVLQPETRQAWLRAASVMIEPFAE